MWVRRTMNWQGNSFLCGRSGFNPFSHAPVEIIGWPLSGDQYYEVRPSAAQAAWDGDAAQFTGLPGFVIATSGAGLTGPGMTLRAGLFITNWTIMRLELAALNEQQAYELMGRLSRGSESRTDEEREALRAALAERYLETWRKQGKQNVSPKKLRPYLAWLRGGS